MATPPVQPDVRHNFGSILWRRWGSHLRGDPAREARPEQGGTTPGVVGGSGNSVRGMVASAPASACEFGVPLGSPQAAIVSEATPDLAPEPPTLFAISGPTLEIY